MALTIHPHLVPRLKKEQSYTFTPPLCLHDSFWCELYLVAFYSNLTSVCNINAVYWLLISLHKISNSQNWSGLDWRKLIIFTVSSSTIFRYADIFLLASACLCRTPWHTVHCCATFLICVAAPFILLTIARAPSTYKSTFFQNNFMLCDKTFHAVEYLSLVLVLCKHSHKSKSFSVA